MDAEVTTSVIVLFATFIVLLFASVPISICIVVSSLVTALGALEWEQICFLTMQKMNSGIESFSLLAVPLFILAGNIMNNGGIANRLIDFAKIFVGRIPGSLAQTNVLGNMFFGALAGSAVAASAAIGGTLAAKHMALMHACIDIERIGDHAQTLVKRSRKIFEEDIVLSPEARQEIAQLGQLTEKALEISLQSFADNDMKRAEQAWSVCRQVKAAQKEMRKNHIRRLNEGACHPDSGLVFLELLINMKRTSDQAKNISQMVLGIF